MPQDQQQTQGEAQGFHISAAQTPAIPIQPVEKEYSVQFSASEKDEPHENIPFSQETTTPLQSEEIRINNHLSETELPISKIETVRLPEPEEKMLPEPMIEKIDERKVLGGDDDEDFEDLPPQRIELGKQMILSLFDFVRQSSGSDMHITQNNPPKMRHFGEIESLPGAPNLTEEQAEEIIRASMTLEIWKEFKKTQDVDFSYVDTKGRRYRCNAMNTLKGIAAVYRIISEKIMSFEELSLPESVRNIINFKKGLVLVTGSSGCGKSTTLATLVEMMNEKDEGHILTIEDPVEILHTSKKSLVNHREVKTHTKSFARALKSALREDPDCIMIGEMRDLETIQLALTAAETGHLVFGTLHTSSAPNTITRIIDVFPPGEQPQIRAMLAEGVQCIISQVLCKRKDGKGRIGVYEVMFGTISVRNLIRKNKIFQLPSTIATGMRYGMQTLDQSLQKLVKEGVIDIEEARQHASHPEEIVE